MQIYDIWTKKQIIKHSTTSFINVGGAVYLEKEPRISLMRDGYDNCSGYRLKDISLSPEFGSGCGFTVSLILTVIIAGSFTGPVGGAFAAVVALFILMRFGDDFSEIKFTVVFPDGGSGVVTLSKKEGLEFHQAWVMARGR